MSAWDPSASDPTGDSFLHLDGESEILSGDGGTGLEVPRSVKETIPILVVDDERTLRKACASALSHEGFPVSTAGDGPEAVRLMGRMKPAIVLLDLYLPEAEGMELLAKALELDPECLVIMMTGKASVDSSIRALKAGAWNYVPKPFSATHLKILIGRAAHSVMVARESKRAREERGEHGTAGGEVTLLGNSEALRSIIRLARQVAATDASVFICGESGTGKELIAQFIHQNSRRSARQMISINSAAMPETLLESEMFGHVEGAFTGAVRDKPGLLEAVNGGTLFLDEINEMPGSVQAKLLRVVQDGVVRRVGSTSINAVVDVRFIAAMNQDPEEALESGKLRHDLHYRLCVFPIHIPPLRQRPEDTVLLAKHFLNQFWTHHRGDVDPPPVLSEGALDALQGQRWPGNIRELRNVMEHTVVILPQGATEVDADILPLRSHGSGNGGAADTPGAYPLHEEYHQAREMVLGDFERSYLRHVVRRANGNLTDAARIAGVDRATLYRMMDKHNFAREDLLKVDAG